LHINQGEKMKYAFNGKHIQWKLLANGQVNKPALQETNMR